jgi:hypothetical protein
LLTLSLVGFYLFGLAVGFFELLRRNQKYGGMFWTNKFYLSPVLLFISVPLAVFLGARFGSNRSPLRFAALILVFVVAAAAVPYTDIKDRPIKELNYSTDIVAGESSKFSMRLKLEVRLRITDEFSMRLKLEVRLRITDDPMRFRAFPAPPAANDRSGWTVTVLGKDSTFAPDIHMTMNVDGKEIESSMWPINSADGSSHIDFGHKQDYSDIINWRVGPNPDLLDSLVNAHHITLIWGNVKVVLPDEQVESLRTFVRQWRRMLHDEGMLCTNPLCTQAPLNPQP